MIQSPEIDEHTWEMWDLGPFTFELHEDWETKEMTIYCIHDDWPYWQEGFYGDTLKEAMKQAANRCLTIFEEWAEEARAV